ncbi:Polyphenol oxidase [Streptomyces sp. RB5]|uniref:Purine nucleoside phosphorylase n=1 Tax=Streptomyces smaragdinus TaxID=2585196 RepID=A0A7K0CTG1_9ACTN|nr:peptidoglycan editing factor PgeF [Streptomyces smaragdinus]MQY16776.1 Polyphenol oxidase [Streptomyces smaragdinus]
MYVAFTDRWGGVSRPPFDELNLGGAVGDDPEAVRENRRRAAEKTGLDPDRVVWMNQVHGNDVAEITAPWKDREVPRTDGVVTREPGLALAVLTADCTPVLLADADAGVIGAAHAGRPGLLAGVVPATVAAMRALGADPARITAHLGPAVCGACYEVPEAMRAEAAAQIPESYATTTWGTPAIDIGAGVTAQLTALGVARITNSPVCTRESADHFSYRRDKTTGRLASYIWTDPR